MSARHGPPPLGGVRAAGADRRPAHGRARRAGVHRRDPRRASSHGLLTGATARPSRHDRQVDFSFAWAGAGPQARFRANAFLQKEHPALALRLIPGDIPTPEQIGLPHATAGLVTRPHGLVLMTGPTGSGKSTTLAAMLGWINRNRPVHILTIEDPIEYVHRSEMALVNQREVGDDVHHLRRGPAGRAA